RRLGWLVAPTAVSATGTSTRITAATATAITAATARFLGARFVDLQSAAFDIHAIEFADGLGGVVSGSQFHEAETTRAPGFAVGNDASRGHLISLRNEELLQRFIRHAKR